MSEPFDVGDLLEEAWLDSSFEATNVALERSRILEALDLPAHALRTVPTDSVEPQGASIHYLWVYGRPVGLQHVKRLNKNGHLYRVTTSPIGSDLITLGSDVGVMHNRVTVHRAAMRGRPAEQVPPPVARRPEPKSTESPRRRSWMEEQIVDVMGRRFGPKAETLDQPSAPSRTSYSLTKLSFHVAVDDHGIENVDQATRAWVGKQLEVGGRKLGEVVGLSWTVDGSELRLDVELYEDCAAVVPLPVLAGQGQP